MSTSKEKDVHPPKVNKIQNKVRKFVPESSKIDRGAGEELQDQMQPRESRWRIYWGILMSYEGIV